MIELRPDATTAPLRKPFRGGLAVLSGPSGSGKTSICKSLLADPRVELSVSATTRPPRQGERHGVDYWFFSVERFQELVAGGAFVEWAQVYGNGYGTLRAPLEAASRRPDRLMLLDIDVQGAAQLRRQGIDAVSIFIAPPSIEELRSRLSRRASDAPEVIAKRLHFAEIEMEQRGTYDWVVVNAQLEPTIAAVKGLLGL